MDTLQYEKNCRELADTLELHRNLISILQNHCGERGNSEGAVETLKRIIAERDLNYKIQPLSIKTKFIAPRDLWLLRNGEALTMRLDRSANRMTILRVGTFDLEVTFIP